MQMDWLENDPDRPMTRGSRHLPVAGPRTGPVSGWPGTDPNRLCGGSGPGLPEPAPLFFDTGSIIDATASRQHKPAVLSPQTPGMIRPLTREKAGRAGPNLRAIRAEILPGPGPISRQKRG